MRTSGVATKTHQYRRKNPRFLGLAPRPPFRPLALAPGLTVPGLVAGPVFRVPPVLAGVAAMPAAVALPVEPDPRVDPVLPVAADLPLLALRRVDFAATHVSADPAALLAPEPFGGFFLDLVAACLPPREAR
jgi:hypothetical protein